MGKEIEMKVPVSENEFQRLLDFASKTKSGVEHYLKKDEYYSRYDSDEERKTKGEPKVIRIRTEKSDEEEKHFFTIKYKTIENGTEFNDESETFIEDVSVLEKFLKVSDYKKYFEKTKESYSAYYDCDSDKQIVFHIELVIINGLHYVEIEVTDSPADPKKVSAELEKFFTFLGLDSSKKDSRSWMQIIKEAQ